MNRDSIPERTRFKNVLIRSSDCYRVAHIESACKYTYTAHHGESCPIAGEKVTRYVLAGLCLSTAIAYLWRKTLICVLLPTWLRPFAAEEGPSRRFDDNLEPKRWTHWSLALLLIAVFGFVLTLVPVILEPTETLHLFEIVPWLSVVIMTIADRPTRTPHVLLIQYFFMLLSGAVVYSMHFLDDDLLHVEPTELLRVAFAALALICICIMPLRDPAWDVFSIGSAKLSPSFLLLSPEDSLSLFRFWTVSWINPLVVLCQKRRIIIEDVWQLPFDFQHTRLYLFFREVRGRLLLCLIKANGLDLFISTSTAAVGEILHVARICLTSNLYQALDIGDSRQAIYWGGVMLAIDAVRQILKTTADWYSRKAYERSRAETLLTLFGKLLTHVGSGFDADEGGPQAAKADSTDEDEAQTKVQYFFSHIFRRRKTRMLLLSKGPAYHNTNVVALFRSDTREISQRFRDFQKLVSQPIKILLIMYYLVYIMGWPSTIGFILMTTVLICDSLLVRYLVKLEQKRTARTDKRVQALSRFVDAIRLPELSGCTKSWIDRFMKLREQETMKRLQIAYVTATRSTLNITGSTSYPLTSIALLTLVLKRGLPNHVIWPSLQLFSQLEASVTEAVDLVSTFQKTTISIKRAHQYMNEPDRDVASSITPGAQTIAFQDASFTLPSADAAVLRNLKFEIGSGLTIVRGKRGAGKSSLLLAMLNEIEMQGGTMTLPNESIGYAQQFPWLQNKTIQENIVFHHTFDAHRYRQVIHACALSSDFVTFADGDMTKLGEGGIELSSGEKARVALARAVYSPNRVLLLDDPLALLNHDTAAAIVQQFLQGPLAKGRMIVMVSNRDNLVLRIADAVIDVDHGSARMLSPAEVKEALEHHYHAGDGMKHGNLNHSAAAQEALLLEGKIEPEETTEMSGFLWFFCLRYMEAGGWHLWVMLVAAYSISRYCDIARIQLFEEWGKDTATGPNAPGTGYWGLPSADRHPTVWLCVFAGLSAGQIVSYGAAQILLARTSVNAAQGLFRTAVKRVSQAALRYHDTTPTDQLKKWLIDDMSIVDGGILQSLGPFIFSIVSLLMSLVAITTRQPSLLAVLSVVLVLFVYFFWLYVPLSRCLRHLKMRALAPIIANVGVTQDGLVTIRAMRAESHFQRCHIEAMNNFQRLDHFFWSIRFWLDFRLSMSSALALLMVGSGAAPSAVGFVLTQAAIAIAALQQLCERFAQLQLDVEGLGRVSMLNRLPSEPGGGDEPLPD